MISVSLEAAETALQAAVRASDVESLEDLLHDELRYVGPDGRALSKADDLAAHRSGALAIVELVEMQRDVQQFGGLGITRVWLRLRGCSDGETFGVQMVYTRTWQNHDGRWRVVAAQGSAVSFL